MNASPVVSAQPFVSPATTAPRAKPPAPAPLSRRAELIGLAAILAQLLLVVLVMRVTGIETLGFRRVIFVVVAGFIVHHFLPPRLRLAFFTLLSLAGMVFVLGGIIDHRVPDLGRGLARTGAIAAGGALLIGICHLPINFWLRAAALATAGTGLALLRADIWDTGLLAIAWPILGSMFMFRAIVYLYDHATARQKPTAGQAASYFFLLPNCSSLLFPVIDFRTMAEKRYDEAALAIYQRGATWMARGVLHLLVYRFIDRLLSIEAANVRNGTDLIQFVVTNMFLYLKVSGLFHLIAGMLLLFGFNLPETNRRYFLASSFTDYWRRVNIYWRNFIMKVFYYPAFFRLKHLGQAKALALATLWSFFVTWALHLYQTWWIKGSVSWTWPDALFWGILGVLVLVNSLWELRRNRARKLSQGSYTAREAALLALRTAGTFAAISLLWSLWSTPTLALWLHNWTLADWHTLAWAGVVLVGIMLATVGFEVLPGVWRARAGAGGKLSAPAHPPIVRRAFIAALPLLAIYAAALPRVRARLEASASPLGNDAAAFVQVLSEKDDDARSQGRGYYESLTSTDQGGSQFFETMNPGQGLRLHQPTREVPGVHFRELTPSSVFEHHGWRFTTNRWGMRDRSYDKTKPAGAHRLALLGSSHVMGYGLPDAAMFEPAIERRLNAEHGATSHFEILNFSIGGLSPIGQLWLLQDRVGSFNADTIVFVGHLNDFDWSTRDLARIVHKRLPLPEGFPPALLEHARVDGSTSEFFAISRLRSAETQILSFCYREIVRLSRGFGARPVYVFLPLPTEIPLDLVQVERQLALARAAGFVVLDLSDVYTGHDPATLTLTDQGHHLNPAGAAIVADKLYQHLIANPELALVPPAPAGRVPQPE